MASIEKMLENQDERYCSFVELARIAQSLKNKMAVAKNWRNLSDDKKEALEIIANKIAHILNCNPGHINSWHDIADYATLVADQIARDKGTVVLNK